MVRGDFKKLALLLTSASLLLGGASEAGAADFVVVIKNTSARGWSPGLLTLQPLMGIGPVPQPGQPEYATYAFAHFSCNVSDQFCRPPCSDTGNAAVLAARWGLTLGTDAWLVPNLPPGAQAMVSIRANAPAELSYLAFVQSSPDDFVAMNPIGDTTDFSVPLFEPNGLPRSPLTFQISGYDSASTDPGSGNSPECAPVCPPPASCFVAPGNGSTGLVLPPQPEPPGLTLASGWPYTDPHGHSTDGIALADFAGGATNELVVSMEGASYYTAAPYAGTGRAIVLSRDAALHSTFDAPAGRDLMGFPLAENLDDAGKHELIVNEFGPPLAPRAGVFARRADATALWTSTGYAWPGFWNMGPSAGDVRTDIPGNEVVVGDWGGNVLVLRRGTGGVLSSTNLFASQSERIYGHLALANLDGAPGDEVVVAGASSGRVLVVKVTPAAASVIYASAPLPDGGTAAGSGAAIGDIDGDASSEIVVADWANSRIYAFSTSTGTTCEHRWLAPGGSQYYWTSPVIGDVDGDNVREVVVFSRDGVLSVLGTTPPAGPGCRDGTVEWTYAAGGGGRAWFTPALGNLTGSSAIDVVVATHQVLEVVDVAARSLAWRFVDSTARFYPTAVFEPRTAGSRASIFVSGWSNGKVYRLDTPLGAPAPVAWPTFMGGNNRAGAR